MVAFCLNGFNGSPYVGVEPDLPASIDAAARAGFAFFAPDRFSLAAWLEGGRSLDALARCMSDAGIACGFIGASALLGGPGVLEEEMAAARRAAETLGAPFVQVNVAIPEGPSRIEAIEKACIAMDGSGLRIAIEYMPQSALRCVAETLAMVDHVGRDRAGVMIDIWHHSRGPDDWDDLAAIPVDAIAYVEFCDALPMICGDLSYETLSRRVFPGGGEFDVGRFARTLRGKGFDGMVSIEVLNAEWRARPLQDFADKALRSSRPYWVS